MLSFHKERIRDHFIASGGAASPPISTLCLFFVGCSLLFDTPF